jgi:hypothetical protein
MFFQLRKLLKVLAIARMRLLRLAPMFVQLWSTRIRFFENRKEETSKQKGNSCYLAAALDFGAVLSHCREKAVHPA